ncbi:MAG: four helix bundle protein [Phycisphaerae bacterium]|jgi:four helix bundle protein
MKYERFEQLPVWKDSARFAAEMFRWTNQQAFKGKGDLANQLQRAALSISNNIAEGFERGTNKELIAFLYYSRGSAGEVRSMLCMMGMMDEFSMMKQAIEEHRGRVEDISKQLFGWLNSLQNSNYKGIKHLDAQTHELEDK